MARLIKWQIDCVRACVHTVANAQGHGKMLYALPWAEQDGMFFCSKGAQILGCMWAWRGEWRMGFVERCSRGLLEGRANGCGPVRSDDRFGGGLVTLSGFLWLALLLATTAVDKSRGHDGCVLRMRPLSRPNLLSHALK